MCVFLQGYDSLKKKKGINIYCHHCVSQKFLHIFCHIVKNWRQKLQAPLLIDLRALLSIRDMNENNGQGVPKT